MQAEVVRLRKLSRSHYITIPPTVLKHLRLDAGDFMALKCVEGKMVLERIAIEQVAKLKAQNLEPEAV
jgi:antitoxin component of MazEF toxin-antitoxin module